VSCGVVVDVAAGEEDGVVVGGAVFEVGCDDSVVA
jgi:hypothetical protein